MKIWGNKRLFVFSVLISVVLFLTGMYAYNNYQFNRTLQTAENLVQEEKFDEAIIFYQKALQFKKTDLSEKLGHVEVLKNSKALYTEGSQFYEQKEYKKALDAFKRVSSQDERYYPIAQGKIKEYIATTLDKAKNEAQQKNYSHAVNTLKGLLEVDPGVTEAQALIEQFQEEIKKIEEEQKRLAELKAQEENAKIVAEAKAPKAITPTTQPSQPSNSNYQLLYKNNKSGWLTVEIGSEPYLKNPIQNPIWDLEIFIKDSKIHVNIKNSDIIMYFPLKSYISVSRYQSNENPTKTLLWTYNP